MKCILSFLLAIMALAADRPIGVIAGDPLARLACCRETFLQRLHDVHDWGGRCRLWLA